MEGNLVAAVEVVACLAQEMAAARLATVLVASERSPAAARVPVERNSTAC